MDKSDGGFQKNEMIELVLNFSKTALQAKNLKIPYFYLFSILQLIPLLKLSIPQNSIYVQRQRSQIPY